MESRKAELLERIESDREVLLDFFRRFIRCPSPNPPGDTREAAGDRKSTRLNSSHSGESRMPSSA